jgi:periplasmic divalent cation tolerance protein
MGMLMVLTTVPDEDSASKIARELVENRLAACCSIIDGLKSIYWWEGKIEESNELLLLIKTSEKLYSEVEGKIKSLHPYTTPEIVAFKAEVVYSEYLRWLMENVQLRK